MTPTLTPIGCLILPPISSAPVLPSPALGDIELFIVFVPIMTLCVFYLFRLYAIQHISSSEEFRRIAMESDCDGLIPGD